LFPTHFKGCFPLILKVVSHSGCFPLILNPDATSGTSSVGQWNSMLCFQLPNSGDRLLTKGVNNVDDLNSFGCSLSALKNINI